MSDTSGILRALHAAAAERRTVPAPGREHPLEAVVAAPNSARSDSATPRQQVGAKPVSAGKRGPGHTPPSASGRETTDGSLSSGTANTPSTNVADGRTTADRPPSSVVAPERRLRDRTDTGELPGLFARTSLPTGSAAQTSPVVRQAPGAAATERSGPPTSEGIAGRNEATSAKRPSGLDAPNHNPAPPSVEEGPDVASAANNLPAKAVQDNRPGMAADRRGTAARGEGERIGEAAAAAPAEVSGVGLFGDAPAPGQRKGRRAATTRSADMVEGHRNRLRARFDRGETLADYELLELVLFRAIPRRDTKPIAKAMLARFGSFAEALAAPAARLTEIDGVGERVVSDMRIVRAAAERFALADLRQRPSLSSTAAVADYYRTKLKSADREEFHVLFLDKRNKFLASECAGVGTVDHTPVYPREVIARALTHGATAIVLVHNHPSGDPTPSRADITMTEQIIRATAAVDVSVHDHIIIAGNAYLSMRGEGFI